MARDVTLALRRAILAALEDSPAVTAIVPVERIHAVEPPAEPLWPFIRYGLATATPLRASGLDGSRVSTTIHAFAKGPQEDAVSALGAAVGAALHGGDGRGLRLVLDVDPPATALVATQGCRLLRDAEEAGAYQIVVDVEAMIIG